MVEGASYDLARGLRERRHALGPAAPSDFEALVQKYLEQRWAASPVEASSLGVPGYDPLLPDFSLEAIAGRVEAEKQLLAAVRGVDAAALSFEQRIDRSLILAALEHSLRNAERRKPWEVTPDLYLPFAALSPFLEKEDRPLEERARHLSARLRAVPKLLAEGRRNLKNPPRAFTEAAIFQAGGTLGFLKEEVPAFAERAGAERGDLLAANARAVEALTLFEAYLKSELLPRSNGSWMLGREDYDFILKRRWFLTDDAEAILAKGRRAFEETEPLARQVAGRIAPGKDWVEVYEKLKDDHPPAEGIKAAYQAQMDAARAFLIEHQIVTLPPGERVVSVDTPPAMRLPLLLEPSIRWDRSRRASPAGWC
jgi:uncharacterized protein (DUF885 family)